MTFDVCVSGQAKQDMGDIYDYIADDLQNPFAAEGVLSKLEKAILSLDEMPERYRAYEKEPWQSRGLRVRPVGRYIVYYIPDTKSHIVTVVRVLYGGRDTDEQLRETDNIKAVTP